MPEVKFLILLFVVALVSIPIVYSVRKFTDYETTKNFSVTFDPVTCYECTNCPCEFTINNGDTYTLSSKDKNKCTTNHEIINRGIKNNLDSVTVEFDVNSYPKFFDCLRWYSAHPSLN